MSRASGPPDSALFSKTASVGIRGYWCERYDESGVSSRSGPYRELYPDGSLRARGTYVDSRLAGPVVAFHENGEFFLRGFLEAGRWTGPFEIFHENGAAWLQGNMIDGKLHGQIATFFPDGGRESEARYQSGREDGLARSFYPITAGGRLQSEVRVEADQLVGKHRLLDRSGTLSGLIDWDLTPPRRRIAEQGAKPGRPRRSRSMVSPPARPDSAPQESRAAGRRAPTRPGPSKSPRPNSRIEPHTD